VDSLEHQLLPCTVGTERGQGTQRTTNDGCVTPLHTSLRTEQLVATTNDVLSGDVFVQKFMMYVN